MIADLLALVPRPWRAWHTFLVSLASMMLLMTAFLLVSIMLQLTQGEMHPEQIDVMLALLYRVGLPVGFLAIGSFGWHAVRLERGDYA